MTAISLGTWTVIAVCAALVLWGAAGELCQRRKRRRFMYKYFKEQP